jgi:hypothetical protein
MPSLDEWEQALTAPRRVTVESSIELVQRVQRLHDLKDAERQQRGQTIPNRKQNLSEVAVFSPSREIDIVPAYLLLRLGVVTTPAIENLADICSTWAHFRYLWAFEIPNLAGQTARLRLSEEATRIDFHQKALLSDEIGVGISAVLLGIYFDAPEALDVSLALDNPDWGIERGNNSSPDYLFFDSTQTNLYVVECKGTQTSRSVSLDQLRRGTEQVQSLTFNDRPTPPSLVIATCLTRTGTRVLIVDPPGEDEKKPHSERAERINEREWRIPDTAQFSQSTRLLSQAKILSFAGDDELSQRKIDQTEIRIPTRRRTAREPEMVTNEFGEFRGVRYPVGLAHRMRIDVFQGIAREVYDALAGDDAARVNEETRGFRERLTQTAPHRGTDQPVSVSHTPGTLIVRTAGPDGSILEFQVSAR